jgi:hypothetical protein
MKTLSSAPRLIFMKVKQQAPNSASHSAILAALIENFYDEKNEYQIVRPDDNFFQITLFEISPRVVKIEEGTAAISSNSESGAYNMDFSINFDNATLDSKKKFQFLSEAEGVCDSGTFTVDHFELYGHV